MLKTPLFTVIPEDNLLKFFKAAELLLLEHKTGKIPLSCCATYCLNSVRCVPTVWGFPSINQAILFVKTHFRDSPSLNDTAEPVGLSPVYFGSLFKKTTWQSYTEYLTACKLSCAEMLLQNGMDVAGACFSSGFGSLSGFLYSFKEYIGMSPAEYKKSEN